MTLIKDVTAGQRVWKSPLCGRKFGRWYSMIWMEKIIGSYD